MWTTSWKVSIVTCWNWPRNNDLHQRTREGIETARLNGKQIGRQKNSVVVTRKSIESKEVIRKLSKEFGGNLSDAEIMRLTGLARNTYYKYKRELRGK